MATFYRLVQTNPPSLGDFISDRQSGKPMPSERWLHTWDGFSVMDTEERARKLVQRFPQIGAYIAAIEVGDDAEIRVQRSYKTTGHYTMWGDPARILSRVESVVAV